MENNRENDCPFDPNLLNVNWQERLPFLAWSQRGSPRLSFDTESGAEGYATIDGSVIPCWTDDRLAEYEMVTAYQFWKKWHDAIYHAYESIVDINNDQPFSAKFVMENPECIRWLNGENDDYRPSITEYRVFHAAYSERKRRIKERVNVLPVYETRPYNGEVAKIVLSDPEIKAMPDIEDILPEFQTRTMTKSEAGAKHGNQPSNPRQYINRLIKKGRDGGGICKPMGSGQQWVFDIRDFPEAIRESISPKTNDKE